MTKWEYKPELRWVYSGSNDERVKREMDALGEEGWDITITSIRAGTGIVTTGYTYITGWAKREVQDDHPQEPQ